MRRGVAASTRAFVVDWDWIPTPYTIERFTALAARGNLDFEAWFSRLTEQEHGWDFAQREWAFPHRFIRTSDLLSMARAPQLLVTRYGRASFLAGSMLARLRGTQVGFWVEITFESWFPRRRWKEFAKQLIIRRAAGILAIGPDGLQYASRYGVAPERVEFVRHSVDIRHYGRDVAAARKERLRSELRLRGVVFLYVGRFWSGKGLADLLAAFAVVQASARCETSLLLVGDGPQEKDLREQTGALRLNNVVFAGFRQKVEMPDLYGVSDVFVFPTLGDPYGMVVDEAMAAGLPIVTTTAAGEIRERIVEGCNGRMVAPHAAGSLAAAMLSLTDSPELRRRMGEESKRLIAEHSPDRWAADYERAAAKLLGSGM